MRQEMIRRDESFQHWARLQGRQISPNVNETPKLKDNALRRGGGSFFTSQNRMFFSEDTFCQVGIGAAIERAGSDAARP